MKKIIVLVVVFGCSSKKVTTDAKLQTFLTDTRMSVLAGDSLYSMKQDGLYYPIGRILDLNLSTAMRRGDTIISSGTTIKK